MMITAKNTLAEVVRDYPQTIPFFNELHLDYCCGGGIPLEEAVKGTDLDANKIAADLNAYIAKHNAKPASMILWNISRACPSLTCCPTWKPPTMWWNGNCGLKSIRT